MSESIKEDRDWRSLDFVDSFALPATNVNVSRTCTIISRTRAYVTLTVGVTVGRVRL